MTTCGHEPIIAELRQALAEKDARIAALEETVEKLTALVDELRAQLHKNSSNSSKPPSSDPPWAPPPPKKKGSGRKPGGQPGHPGHHRALRDPDHVHDLFPEVCRGCGSGLTPGRDSEGKEPIRHQVEELPPVRPEVHEHRLHELLCRDCGKANRAALPAGVPSGHFGPRLMAAVAMLSGKFRLTRRELPKVLADLFGLALSVGTIQKLCERASEAVAGPVEEIAKVVHAAPVVNADETSYPHKAKKSWLWVATSPTATIFRLHQRRGAEGLAVLMPEDHDGLLIVDRWKPYEKFRRSLCHAHLLRNWREIGERKHPEAKRLGKWAQAETERLLKYHRQFRSGEMPKAALASRMRMLKARYWRMLGQALECGDKRTRGVAKDLDRQWDSLWSYLETDGAEPTNNAGERRIRPAVLWRKGSFGTQSDAGQRFVERSLTLAATAGQLGVNLFEYLQAAIGEKLRGNAAPGLHDWARRGLAVDTT